MKNHYYLSGNDRKFIIDFSIKIGATSDQIEGLRFETITPDYARGYLESLSVNGSNKTVLVSYFILSLISAKRNELFKSVSVKS